MKKESYIVSFLLLGVVLLISGCGGGGGGGGGEADTTPPTIVSTNPAADSTGGQTRAVTVTFSEAVKPAAVSSATFTVTRGGTTLPGAVSASGATATFTPYDSLCLFSQHTATVTTGITDLAGNALASDYTWSFTTGDGTWDNGPITIDTSTIVPAPVISPHAGMDDSGNVIAVWLEDDGSDVAKAKVMANRYVPGSGWGTPVRIDSGTNTAGRFGLNPPRIAVNGSGNAVAVWQESQLLQDGITTRYNIWTSRYSATTGQWSNAEPLETNDNAAYTPDIGIDSSGNAIAVWVYSVAGGFNPTYASIYTAATVTWSTPEDITDIGVVIDNSAVPKIAMNGNGKAIVVGSTEVSNVGFRVWAVRYDGASWGAVTMIDGVTTDGGGMGPTPQVAMNEAGDAFSVWEQVVNKPTAPNNTDIWANRFSNNSWSGAVKIRDVGSGTAASEQRVAVDPQGNAFVVWAEVGAAEEILVKRYIVGTGWETSAPPALDDTTKGYDMHPQIAVDDNGNALAVWSDQGKAYAKRYRAGSGWGSTITTLEANSNYGYTDSSPIAIHKGCGNAIAVWLGDRDYNFGIQATRFR